MNYRTFVTYLRVSTDRQGRSGLGLEGQRAAVETYVAQHQANIVREFVEVESGRRDDRPRLAEALAFARRSRATLLVAKLDRLSRSVQFISTTLNSGVEFAAADMPNANRLLLHVLSAVAEDEAKAISDRTKAALSAAKARGTKLGSHNPNVPSLTDAARARGQGMGAKANAKLAATAYIDLIPHMTSLREQGLSYRAIAQRLNDEGEKTRSEKGVWSKTQVVNVLRRASLAA